MRLIKIMMVCSIFTLALAFASCKKGEFSSRDTSGILPEPEIPEPVDPTLVVFDNCDKVDGWDAAGGAVADPSNKKEGENAIKATIGAGDALRMQKALAQPINTNLTRETAQLIFWLFVEDASKVKLSDGQIEVTSSGGADQQEYNWPTSLLNPLQSGWNLIKLNLADAGESGGGADLTKINFFRLYMNTNAAATPTSTFTMALDAIGFVATTSAPSTFVSFLNCDVFDEELWEISGGSGKVDLINKKEGAGALFGKTHPTGGYLHMKLKKPYSPVVQTNLTVSTGQLSFWLFVDKPVTLAGQIEITSSGEPDKKEYNWDASKITGLKPNSWNLVKLNLRDAAVSNDGPPDLNAINFFRMYLETGEDGINIGLDDIKFGSIPPPEPTLLDACDKLDGWDLPGDMAAAIETSGKKEGTGYIKAKVPAGGDFMRFAKVFPTNFDSKVTKENGQLTFWFYIERVSEFKEIQVQISSTDNIDATRYGWSLLESANLGIPALRDGWNEVKLDMSKVSYDADGGADLAAIKYFRIFGFTNSKIATDLNMGLDGIKFTIK